MRSIRVAAHVHSDWSYDGTFPLDRVAIEFGLRGYDAVLLAEHDRTFDATRAAAYRKSCASASTDRTLLVPGIEYSDPMDRVHVPVWGATRFLGAGLRTAELLDEARAADGFALLAHPARRNALSGLDPTLVGRFDGLELWNRKYDGIAPGLAAREAIDAHPWLLPFVSLDFHTARQFHPLAMELVVDGPVSEAAILAALHERRARPRAFGRDATSFARGTPGSAVRSLERGRRRVAPLARAIRGLAPNGARPRLARTVRKAPGAARARVKAPEDR